MIFKFLFLPITIVLLSGCAAHEKKTEIKPNTGISLYSEEEMRSVKVTIKTNDQNLNIVYSNFINSKIPKNKKFQEHISKGDFSGELKIPINQEILITANDYNDVDYYIKGFDIIKPADNNISINIESLEIYPALLKLLSNLSKEQKANLLMVLGLYEEAINSPKFIASSTKAKADAELRIFYLDNDLKHSLLGRYLSKIAFNIYLANLYNKKDLAFKSEEMISKLNSIIH